jgi:hypothetical protein
LAVCKAQFERLQKIAVLNSFIRDGAAAAYIVQKYRQVAYDPERKYSLNIAQAPKPISKAFCATMFGTLLMLGCATPDATIPPALISGVSGAIGPMKSPAS